ncbi:MAG: 5-(carboxyamino)imidazole ribonucleotide mutase [Armatimonadetes bacterium]|nr:5-(carboxyamino)imidazole ribonucleotide mutase [Armatimonadota bacterium]
MDLMRPCWQQLEELGIPFEVHIASAHRTPDLVAELAASARERGFGVVIAGAGWAAHLAGAVAANTTLPVIAVPLATSPLAGIDALLASVQMPSGVPVATVAVNCARNAAWLAAEILAVYDLDLAEVLCAKRAEQAEKLRSERVDL